MAYKPSVLIACDASFGRPRVGLEALNNLLNLSDSSIVSKIDCSGGNDYRSSDSKAIIFSVASPLESPFILDFLNSSNIPLDAANRTEDMPLIIGGGMGFFNPEPLSSFFDVIIPGPSYSPIFSVLSSLTSVNRDKNLENLCSLGNAYIPSRICCEFDNANKINSISSDYLLKQIHSKMDFPISQKMGKDSAILMPDVGCKKNCYFCELTNFFDYTEESTSRLINEIKNLNGEGIKKIKIVSAHSLQHSGINQILDTIKKYGIGLELGSARIDSMNYDILTRLQGIHRTSETAYLYKKRPKNDGRAMTFGIECGSDKLMYLINKQLTVDDVRNRVARAINSGIHNIGFYFLVGLPSENNDDLRGISDLVSSTVDLLRPFNGEVYASINPLIPSPNTPMQRCSILGLENYSRKLELIRANIVENLGIETYRNHVNFYSLDPGSFLFETISKRGDRRVGKFIESAYHSGILPEKMTEQNVAAILYSLGLPKLDFYRRQISLEEILPWDLIRSKKAYLHEKDFYNRLAEVNK